MWKITLSYDDNPPRWENIYEDEFAAWQDFFEFVDWGFADEYAIVNMYTPSLKCYTRIFYREGRKVVTK